MQSKLENKVKRESTPRGCRRGESVLERIIALGSDFALVLYINEPLPSVPYELSETLPTS